MNILQYNIANNTDGGKLTMINSLETGTEKTFINLHKLNGISPQWLKLLKIFCFLLNWRSFKHQRNELRFYLYFPSKTHSKTI